jgi:hypothetical protein
MLHIFSLSHKASSGRTAEKKQQQKIYYDNVNKER